MKKNMEFCKKKKRLKKTPWSPQNVFDFFLTNVLPPASHVSRAVMRPIFHQEDDVDDFDVSNMAPTWQMTKRSAVSEVSGCFGCFKA